MSGTWKQLLARVDSAQHADVLHRANELIRSANLESAAPTSFVNSVTEVLSLWQVRQKISHKTDFTIPGVETLIGNLKALPAESVVEQFGFTGDKLAGSLFFDRKTGAFLGDTIVARRPKSQEMLDLEAQMLQPSRKSA